MPKQSQDAETRILKA